MPGFMCATCKSERDAAARITKAQETNTLKKMEKAAIPSKANGWAWTEAKDEVQRLKEWTVKGRAKTKTLATLLDPRNVAKGKKKQKRI